MFVSILLHTLLIPLSVLGIKLSPQFHHVPLGHDGVLRVGVEKGPYFYGWQLAAALDDIIHTMFHGDPSSHFDHIGVLLRSRSRLLFWFESNISLGLHITQGEAKTSLQGVMNQITHDNCYNGLNWAVMYGGSRLGRGIAIGNPSSVDVRPRYLYNPEGYSLAALADAIRAAAFSLGNHPAEELSETNPRWSYTFRARGLSPMLFYLTLAPQPASSPQILLTYNVKKALLRMADRVGYDRQETIRRDRGEKPVAGVAFLIKQNVLDVNDPHSLDTRIMAQVNTHIIGFGGNATVLQMLESATNSSGVASKY